MNHNKILGSKKNLMISLACPGQRSGGERWIACRPNFFLPVRVLSKRFRWRFLERLRDAHDAGRLSFFNDLAPLAERDAFDAHLAPLLELKWVVYAKPPVAGPAAGLAYLARYTHRVAISNSRLVACDATNVSFKYKDYRAKGRARHKTMTLPAHEFIRRFLIHVLPSGFHRIRHYGLFANGGRVRNIAQARELLGAVAPETEPAEDEDTEAAVFPQPCPCCGGRMIIVETFERGGQPRAPPMGTTGIDVS